MKASPMQLGLSQCSLPPKVASSLKKRRKILPLILEWNDCRKCNIGKSRENIVFGKGFVNAPVVLVGEAPGEREDEQGIPFVGPAGQLLDEILDNLIVGEFSRALSYKHDDCVPWRRCFITNIVACRPRGRRGNRQPNPQEISKCRPRLEATLNVIRPRIIVALGRVAEANLIGHGGLSFPLKLQGVHIFQVTHPAAYLYGGKERMREDKKVWVSVVEKADELREGLRPTSIVLPLLTM